MKSFDEFLGENNTKKLSRKFGLSEPMSLEELRENYMAMKSAWMENPKVKDAIKTLKDELSNLYPQYIDEDSPEFEQFNDELHSLSSESDPGDIDLFDFIWFQ